MTAPSGYSRAQIGLHWAIMLLVGLQFIFHQGIEKAWEAVEKGLPIEGIAAPAHVITGVIVLVLVVVRLFLRFKRGVPDLPADGQPLLDKAAKATHLILGLLLVLIPMSGISAWFFGVETAATVHGVLFKLLFVLVFVHAAAALYHQYILKDGLIQRMTRPDQN